MPTKMTFGDVYMINPTTGEKTPVGSVSDAEITCDTETTDIRSMVSIVDVAESFCADLQIALTDLSDNLRKLLSPRTLTNNYRRFHGESALRWRKFDRTIYH